MRKLILKVSVLSYEMMTNADVVVNTKTGRPFMVGTPPKDLIDMVESGILTHPENIQDNLKEFTYLFDPNDLSKVLEARRAGVEFLKPFVIS